MLVLYRRKNEGVVINNDITVTVIEIRDDKVRLGFVAPKEVPVHRKEVFDAIYGGIAPTQNESTPAHPEKAPVLLADRHMAFVDHLAAAWKQTTGVQATRSMVVESILDAVQKFGAAFPWNR